MLLLDQHGRPLRRSEDLEASMAALAEHLRRRARFGVFTGRCDPTGQPYEADYLKSCRRFHRETGTTVIFTRDTGHHTAGWFKNPDYERCLHLSLSYQDPAFTENLPQQFTMSRIWVRLFFGEDLRHLWAESPKSAHGKRAGVWHWRLFCDERWSVLAPRGEVYSLEFTQKGWRSASQVLEEDGVLVESVLNPG